jgi:hypothetical protein
MVLFSHFFAVAFLGVFRLLFVPNNFVKRFILPPDSFMSELKVSANNPMSQIVYGLMTVYWWLMAAVGVVLTLPVNLFLGLRVLITACVIIVPLIWAELRV